MARYNVYGIGNALVDIEFEVPPSALQELQIDKGVMTLIDEEHQHRIMAHLDGQTTKRSCGGSAANTVIAVSQFGGKAFYSCKVANDETGSFYLEDLIRCGVDTNLQQQVRQEGVTGKCIVLVTPDADRTMTTFLGISGGFSQVELIPDAIREAEYLYMEGYLVTAPEARQAAIHARDIARSAGQKVSLSLSDLNMVKFFKEGLLDMIGPGVDFLFANESEALGMADTEDLNTAMEYLKTLTKQFAITRGPNGSLIFDGQDLIEIEPFQVKAIDTVGAGDMYAGALLYGITHGMSFAQAGKLASLASARLVTTLGPRMPTDQTRSLLQEI